MDPLDLVVETLAPRPHNDIEHEVAFRHGGRRLIARVLLVKPADRAAWAPGSRHAVRLRLVRAGNAVKVDPDLRPGLDDEGHAQWRAIGPITAMEGTTATVDVGFPLAVDLDPSARHPERVPPLAVGDGLAIRGELRIDPAT